MKLFWYHACTTRFSALKKWNVKGTFSYLWVDIVSLFLSLFLLPLKIISSFWFLSPRILSASSSLTWLELYRRVVILCFFFFFSIFIFLHFSYSFFWMSAYLYSFFLIYSTFFFFFFDSPNPFFVVIKCSNSLFFFGILTRLKFSWSFIYYCLACLDLGKDLVHNPIYSILIWSSYHPPFPL